MEVKEPTEAQIKEFWEWCGFRRLPLGNKGYHFESTIKTMNWMPPDKTEIYASIEYLPRIDLNNLFKYTINILDLDTRRKILNEWVADILTNPKKDVAISLFGVINAKRNIHKN